MIGGLLYCACGLRWGARTQKTKVNHRGELVTRKTVTALYYCTQNHLDLVSSECPRRIGAKKAEAQVWEKVCEAVDKPEYLLAQAHNLVEELRASASNLHLDKARIENEIGAVMEERQWVITQARKGAFTTTDMERQLGTLTLQEVNLNRDLSRLGQSIDIDSLDEWETKFEEYLADLKAGLDELKNAAPQNDEERRHVFLLKKQMIDTLVERATINKNREIQVEIRVNLRAILDQDAASTMPGRAYIEKGEIYTRTRSSPAHPHHPSSCA